MKVDGKALAQIILDDLKKQIHQGIERGWDRPQLTIFTVQPTPEVMSFIKSKEMRVKEIGGDFRVIRYKKEPRFIDFANRVAKHAQKKDVSGIVIQHPLPAALSTLTLLDYVPVEKEIEGFKKKAPFEAPIGLAVLTILKKVYSPEEMTEPESVIINLERDANVFKNIFKRKRVVLIGRGITGGQPVGETLTKAKINYINLNSQTSSADTFIPLADVIISAVGQTIIKPDQVKSGATLVSVGLHKNKGTWVGDFTEDAIKDKALAYSPTPGGVGPLNVAYLLSNLVKAWKLQNEARENKKEFPQ